MLQEAGARHAVPLLDSMFLIKAHAYGNDFLFVRESEIARDAARPALAQALCARHAGIGADGLIFFSRGPRGASMQLFNADGSPSEVSGNGVRCLGAILARDTPEAREFVVETGAGEKRLELLERSGARYTFRASMGAPESIERRSLDVGGETVEVVTLRVGNPQCVVLEPPTEDRLRRLGPGLTRHPAFPEGTNVELAGVESPGYVRILIWERGVGPTEASGTGACAAAVAAASYGGASRDVQVVSPGGSQRVEWRSDGLFLTGWAEILFEGQWLL
jgi:diaminopimelate epimerase